MQIHLDELHYSFHDFPLVIGGVAMEYYGLRKSGKDIDLVVSEKDYRGLANLYPDSLKDIYGDLGVIVHSFEIWRTICLYDYEFLKRDALEMGDYLMVSLETLLFMKTLGMHKSKYHADQKLVLKKIFEVRYKNS